MLKRIQVTNFKKFERFSLVLQEKNVLVGPNNSGKSSLLDCLRILQACIRHTKTTSPEMIPDSRGDMKLGYVIPDSIIPVPIANITRDFSDDDAEIEITHECGSKIRISLNPERSTRMILLELRAAKRTSKAFRDAFPLELVIVPTLGPFEEREEYVQDRTVQKNASTRLASRNFRNIWLRKTREEFDEFKRLVEDSWPGLSIKRPEQVIGSPIILQMFFSENRHDREIFWSGFGFQVWLQVLTHILSADPNATLVIDEPDVYLHPDLQRRLTHFVSGRFRQVIMATHAVEIINEVEETDVISVNSRFKTGKRIAAEEDFQQVLRYLGSVENVAFSRLARAKKIIFVEGDDTKLMKRLASKTGNSKFAENTDVLIMKTEGFSQAGKVKSALWAFRQILELELEAVCVFDRDYRPADEVGEFLAEMQSSNLECYVLGRKEIENYFLDPEALLITLRKSVERRGISVEDDVLFEIVDTCTTEMRRSAESQIVEKYKAYMQRKGSKFDPATLHEKAVHEIDINWEKLDYRFSILPGKKLISNLSAALDERFKSSLSIPKLAEDLKSSHIANDMKLLLARLDAFCSRD